MRSVIRGYNALRKNDTLDKVSFANIALTNHRLAAISAKPSAFLTGSMVDDMELAIRQYLLVRFAGIGLNQALLRSKGKANGRVSYSIPPNWREIISEQGFQVATFQSKIKWQISIAAHYLRGLASIPMTILKSLTNTSDFPVSPYVYFDTLGNGNLPQSKNTSENHDIVTWYSQWRNHIPGTVTYCHSVRNGTKEFPEGMLIKSVPGPCPLLKGQGAYLKFIAWGIGASFRCLYELIRGHWVHPLMLREYAYLAQIRFAARELLASEYLFHNSNWIFRPLWTYGAETRGSRITFYFYSTNCEDFKGPDKYPPIGYGWQAMNWPQYLVWDSYQQDFVRRATGPASAIDIVGPIPFHSASAGLPKDLTGFIAVFDIQPVRDAYYKSLGIRFEYYVPDIANQFLTDIFELSRRLGAPMVLKRKRIIGKMAHPKYRALINRLENNPSFRTVDPNLSPQKLIEKSQVVISVPFTSAAILAKQSGKLSIYYDPSGLIQADDRAAHGIPVINRKAELEKWLIVNGLAERSRSKI